MKKFLSLIIILSLMIVSYAKPKNVIVIMGDGMGYNHVLLSELLCQANNLEIATKNFQVASLVRNDTLDNVVTDSGAAATAFFCGEKTKLQYVGMDKEQKSLDSLGRILKRKGYKVGLITNTRYYDATPAGIYAHAHRRDTEKITKDLVSSNFMDFFVAGGFEKLGVNPFTMKPKKDSELKKINENGYKVYGNNYELLFDSNQERFMAFVAPGDKNFENELITGELPFIDVVEKTVEKIKDDQPLFMFVEAGRIDDASHINNTEAVKSELLMFQKIVNYLTKEFNPEETLFIIFADHETGGLSIFSSTVDGSDITIKWNHTDHTGTYVPFLTYGNSKDIFPKQMHLENVKDVLLKTLEVE